MFENVENESLPKIGMIFLVNLVLGWTVLTWIGALLWAIIEKPEEKKAAAEI